MQRNAQQVNPLFIGVGTINMGRYRQLEAANGGLSSP